MSWLNLVERFFPQLTDDVVREDSFTSLGQLVTAIYFHLAHHNLNPTPYRWKAEGSVILEGYQRATIAQANVVLQLHLRHYTSREPWITKGKRLGQALLRRY